MIPEGYKLVPINPTKKMWAAGAEAIRETQEFTRDSYEKYEVTDPDDYPGPCWRAMIAAAPEVIPPKE